MYDVVHHFHIDHNAPYFGIRGVMTHEKMMDFEGVHTEASSFYTIGLCHGVVFTDRFIFRYILENFSPPKWTFRSVYGCIQSVREN